MIQVMMVMIMIIDNDDDKNDDNDDGPGESESVRQDILQPAGTHLQGPDHPVSADPGGRLPPGSDDLI